MNPIRFLIACFMYAVMPFYFGGSSKSSTATTTQNNDNRQVNTTTVETHNTLDGGAIQGMIDVAQQAIAGAGAGLSDSLDYAGSIFDAGTKTINAAGVREAEAWSGAAALVKDALTGAREAYQAQAQSLQGAYADAKGTSDSQKTIVLGVLAVAGVMAFSMMKRG